MTVESYTIQNNYLKPKTLDIEVLANRKSK